MNKDDFERLIAEWRKHIVIEEDRTGYAPRAERFSAYNDGGYEPGMPIGQGATADEAIADLLARMEDES